MKLTILSTEGGQDIIMMKNKKMENNNKSKQQHEILPLYYHKFAQPYLSEERLGYLYASDK